MILDKLKNVMRQNLNIIKVTDFSLKELEPYTCRSEVRLLRYFEPRPGIFIGESAKVINRALNAGYEPVSILIEKNSINTVQVQEILAQCCDIPVYAADMDLLNQLTGSHLTQGILCAMKRRRLHTPEEVCFNATRIAILEDVVNPANVGAIFRSAAALNFDGLLLTPACSDPLYRRSIRVSMGTVFQIPWTYFDCSAPEYVERLKALNFSAVAMALAKEAIRIDDPRLMAEEKLAIIFGNEGKGLNKATIKACDHIVQIPMSHNVDSLNVAAASAVVFWQLGKHNQI